MNFTDFWHKIRLSYYFKKKRVGFALKLLNKSSSLEVLSNKRILDVGCCSGKDFSRLLSDDNTISLHGIDLVDYQINQPNFIFHQSDAEQLEFEDKYFDITFSFGLLEHIQPIEKLCNAIKEIERVSKSYCIYVPSNGTFFDPHTLGFFWQMRGFGKKRLHPQLNYFSDEAWLQFSGFKDAKLRRYWHIPFLIQGLFIYKAG